MTGNPAEPEPPSPDPDRPVVVPLDPERIDYWREVVADWEPLDRAQLDGIAAILDRVRARKRAATNTSSDPRQYPNAA
ncbi:hypothetical protein [Nocardia lijiangensis]|uniref:hypothetical protein n=1 Tax=Nocardia lijiangensis TaxID=299618 RepID=UPI0008295B69|nr:hypothetical protein [Nocardia lijiangensis]